LSVDPAKISETPHVLDEFTKLVYNMSSCYEVVLTRRAAKQLDRMPIYVVRKLEAWRELVEVEGLPEAQKIPGFHDEPLRGIRAGQRSVRLSRAYRAIYRKIEAKIVLILIEEVNKHVY
jgi:proteic killer suppression protein